MGYLFAALALFMGVTKGYCGKKTSGIITTFPSTMLFNAVRMLICIPIGMLVVLLTTGSLGVLAIDPRTLLIAAVAGVSTSVFVVTWIASVRTGAYMMVEVFLTLGVVVPVIGSRIFFAEEIRWNHLAGIALLTGAAYIMCTYNKSLKKGNLTPGAVALMSLSGFANGVTSLSQKWFGYASTAHVSVYNFYTYIFSAAVLLVCWAAVRKKDTGAVIEKQALRKLGVFVVIMSACLFLYSLFSTMAAGRLPSTQLFPLLQGGALVLSMLMSAVFFGEKITLRCILGIAITFTALVFINFL